MHLLAPFSLANLFSSFMDQGDIYKKSPRDVHLPTQSHNSTFRDSLLEISDKQCPSSRSRHNRAGEVNFSKNNVRKESVLCRSR